MRPRLGELLVQENIITSGQLEEALDLQKKSRARIGQALTELGYVNPAQLSMALSRQMGIGSVCVGELCVEKDVLELISQEDAERNIVLPVRLEAGRLTLAMANPLDYDVIENLRFKTGCDIAPLYADQESILEGIEKFYKVDAKAFHLLKDIKTYEDVEFCKEGADDNILNVQSLYHMSETPPIVKLVTMIIVEAVKMRASDIHIEPKEEHVRVRYRIDGDLRSVLTIPNRIKAYVISRIKIISEMDITKRRIPQDGTSKLKLSDREVDLRVSTLPSLYGEKVVIRLLDKSKGLITMEKVGFPERIEASLLRLLNQPQGFVVVTGPTGSGKSTTLYAMLQQIKSDKDNIVTIEEPVEYRLDGVTQVGVKEAIDLSFARVLRSVLRQDPDIIMVGEIRDFETADIAIKSALTGHLVLSTLHTNDTVSTITRLLNLGIPSFLVGSSISCILAQRLVKKICPECRVPDDGMLASNIPDIPGLKTAYRGTGCKRCYGTGYYGQVGVFEYLPVTPKIRKLISDKAPESQLWAQARANGVKLLFEDAIEKVNQGITTLEEALVKVPNLLK
jgi:type IV pilus assembly protein PilB